MVAQGGECKEEEADVFLGGLCGPIGYGSALNIIFLSDDDMNAGDFLGRENDFYSTGQ